MRNTIGIVCVLSLSAGALGQTATWDGDAGDGYWTSQQNWDPDMVPSSSSDVIIPSDAGPVQIILSSESCASLSCMSSLRLTAGTIEVAGTASVTNMSIDGNWASTIFANGNFTISGKGSCTTGQVFGLGSFNNAGIFDAFAFGYDGINGVNSGTWSIGPGGGSLNLHSGAQFTNTGTLILQQNSSVGGLGTLVNTGTISGIASSQINAKFTQTSGTLSANGLGASISLNSDAWNISGGSISVGNNGQVALGGTNLLGTRSLGATGINGTGTVDLFPGNATVNMPNTMDVNVAGNGFVVWSGTLNITGAITNSGKWTGRGSLMGGTGSFDNESGATLEIPTSNSVWLNMPLFNQGTIDVFGTLFLDGGFSLENFLGTIKLRNESFISTTAPTTPGSIMNNGVVQLIASGPNETATIEAPYNSDIGGDLQIHNGTVNLNGGGTFEGGQVSFNSSQYNSILNITGSTSDPYLITGSFELNGTQLGQTALSLVNIGTGGGVGPFINVSGILALNTVTQFRSGEITGTGKITSPPIFYWLGGTIGADFDLTGDMIYISPGTGKTLQSTLKLANYTSVVQEAPLTLQGGTVNNEGSWFMSGGSSIWSLGTQNMFYNTVNFSVNDDNSASHIVATPFSNTGGVFVQKGHLFFTGNVTQLDPATGTLSGGTWVARDGATINFPRSLVQLRGPGSLEGGTNEIPDMASLQSMDNAAIVELLDSVFNGNLELRGASTLKAKGNVTVNGNYTSTGGSKTTVEPGGKMEVTGGMQIGEVDSAADDIEVPVVPARGGVTPAIVTPVLDLYGGIRVGESGSSVVDIQCDLVMQDSARMHVKMMQTGSNTVDLLNITGSASLAGTLHVDAVDAVFVPGEVLTVMVASGGITGSFDAVETAGLSAGETLSASVVGNEVRITAITTCLADLTGDGIVDISDVFAFLAAYNATDPTADLTGDGVVDIADVFAFLGSYNTGCP